MSSESFYKAQQRRNQGIIDLGAFGSRLGLSDGVDVNSLGSFDYGIGDSFSSPVKTDNKWFPQSQVVSDTNNYFEGVETGGDEFGFNKGTLGLALQGTQTLGGLADIYQGFRNYGLATKQFGLEKHAFNTNAAIQESNANNQLEQVRNSNTRAQNFINATHFDPSKSLSGFSNANFKNLELARA
jgi:hypothetical protein